MESSHRIDVIDLDAAHRRALEDVIGTQLRSDQRLIINVTEANGASDTAESRAAQTLEGWARLYEGLSEEEIEVIHKQINMRANLSRDLP